VSEQLPFLILDETSKSFPKFNANGRRLVIKVRTPGEEKTLTPISGTHYCINELLSERCA
jgi:hypothetical protein